MPDATSSEGHPGDLSLVSRCLRGESGAWEDLIRRTEPGLRASCTVFLARCRLPSGPAEAADLVQEVLLQLLERDKAPLRAYQGRASLGGYLSSIAAHLALRRAGRPGVLPLQEKEDPYPAPDEALECIERGGRLREALDRLAPRDRLALTLRMDGASDAEIGRMLGMGAAHAAVVLSRARIRVRDLLRTMGETGEGL